VQLDFDIALKFLEKDGDKFNIVFIM